MKQSMSAPYHPLVTPRLPVATNTTISLRRLNPGPMSSAATTRGWGLQVPNIRLPSFSLPSFSLPSISLPSFGRAGTQNAIKTGLSAPPGGYLTPRR